MSMSFPNELEIYRGSSKRCGITGRHPYHLAQVGDLVEGRRVLTREWRDEEGYVTLRLTLAFEERGAS